MRTVERHRYSNKEIFQTRKLVYDPYDYNERNVCLVIGLIERKGKTPGVWWRVYRTCS